MARNSSKKQEETPKNLTDKLGVADGFDFDTSESNVQSEETPPVASKQISKKKSVDNGQNKYYEYHPRKGARGGSLGAPRKDKKRVQISIGCSEDEKQLYQQAAEADGRKLPDFVNTAIKEYIERHNLQ